ncbi:MAG: PIN domain-containing protein [Nostocales cyanobacterium LacPavin_0920_SED1_MAG_38_18]|nr:PIN domain-containing protein [Nostocales cyanobacterium LacPavin_0920_SED1_MAG_38_18]
MIIYLETNSIMAIAKGRNKELENFVYDSSNNLQFVIPSIWLMETLVAIEGEEKRSQSFSQTIQIEMNEAKRNKELNNSQSFVNYLESSLIDYDDILTDFKKRFLNILEYLRNHGELIEPSIKMLEATLNNPLLPEKNQRRDDFILQVILAHAENNLSINKAFFSENTKEFGNTNIQQILANLGINYFSKIPNLEGWLNKQ